MFDSIRTAPTIPAQRSSKGIGRRERHLVALTSLLLAACVPVSEEFYSPLGSTDIQTQGPCGVNSRRTLYVRLSADVVMALDALSAHAINAAGPHDRTQLLVTLHIPQSHQVTLRSDVLTIDAQGYDHSFTVRIPEILRRAPTSPGSGPVTFTPLMELVGIGRPPDGSGTSVPSIYRFSVDLPVNEPRVFSVTLPDLMVDGVASHLEPITFTMTREIHWAGLCQ